MQVRFWGVRGSVASAGPHVARTGGNTACVEVVHDGHRLILDAGTGLRALGESLLKEGQPLSATVLFSHLHWDHVQGFPFFTQAYLPSTHLALYGPGQGGDVALRKTLSAQMEPPSFPVPFSIMKASMKFHAAQALVPFEVGPFVITPVEAPHPNGCLGYVIEASGQRFAYLTDIEVAPDTLPASTAQVLQGADALVIDAQYTRAEYEGRGGMSKKGWGHSAVEDVADLARDLGVKQLFLFHHDPSRTDDAVDAMAHTAKERFASSEPAREGRAFLLEAA